MTEDLTIISGNKTEQYQSLIPQIKGLLEGEADLVDSKEPDHFDETDKKYLEDIIELIPF